MKDEILEKALDSDTEIIPRYDVVLPDGTKVAENAELVLKNPVTQNGTPFEKSTMLQDETGLNLGLSTSDNPTVDDAFQALTAAVAGIGQTTVIVTDEDGEPIPYVYVEGITVEGEENPQTDSNGQITGKLQSSGLITLSGYVDKQTSTIDVAALKDGIAPVTVIYPSVTDGTVVRYEASGDVYISTKVLSIDVCIVAGGGGGGGAYSSNTSYIPGPGGGGGGGGINNVTLQAAEIAFNTPYTIIIGAGGSRGSSTSSATSNAGGDGGDSSFGSYTATGGEGGRGVWVDTSGSTQTSTKTGSGGTPNGAAGSISGAGSASSAYTFNDASYPEQFGGGGGAGRALSTTVYSGGSPNGASGAAYSGATTYEAGTAGPGGGGGGGVRYSSTVYAYPSSGGAGVVLIRVSLLDAA